MHGKKWTSRLSILLLLAGLNACGTFGHRDGAPDRVRVDVSSIANAVPKAEPLSPYGNPKSYEVLGKTYYPLKSDKGFVQRGVASWYGTKFHGQKTSSGEQYDMYAMTAAHKTLPLPSYVRVTNLDNHRQVIVKVNDRGPFHQGRIIDLSYVAAIKLGIDKTGTANVEIAAIDARDKAESTQAPLSKAGHYNSKGVFVQVGAYSDQENAQSVRHKLAQSDLVSQISPVVINARKMLYRVRMGPYYERETANQVVQNLHRMGMEQARVFFSNEY